MRVARLRELIEVISLAFPNAVAKEKMDLATFLSRMVAERYK